MRTHTTTAAYFDNAKNHGNPAVASAIARAARDAKADGTAYRVDFETRSGAPYYWIGCSYDVLSLAKDLVFNGGTTTTVTTHAGKVLDAEAITAWRF